MFRRLQDWLALTATERKVLLFVTGAFVAGLGIRLYQETFPRERSFDYSASDSAFAALSAAPEETAEAKDVFKGPLDINKATKEQLIALPGIGAVTAERILLYRDDHGPFRSLEDLRKVRGISRRKLDQLRPLIAVF
jgi:competence ComEA-like helix-hairpin-helix protein